MAAVQYVPSHVTAHESYAYESYFHAQTSVGLWVDEGYAQYLNGAGAVAQMQVAFQLKNL